MANEKRKGIESRKDVVLIFNFCNEGGVETFDIARRMTAPAGAEATLFERAASLSPEDTKTNEGRMRYAFNRFSRKR